MAGGTVDKDNSTGTFTVKADGTTITVGADGIKVTSFPVTSVNGEIGEVVLDASDVDAIADANGTFTGTLNGSNITLTGTLDATLYDLDSLPALP